jgi:methyltransferase-like protein
MLLRDLPEEIAQSVNSIAGSQTALEQYQDFVVNRMFRRSLVCRNDVELQRHISVEAIKSCSYRSQIEPSEDGIWTIQKVGGFGAAVKDADVARVLNTLDAAAPGALEFSQLLKLMQDVSEVDEEHLCGILLSLLSLNAVAFRTWSPPSANQVSDRPTAFWPARKRAEAGRAALPTPYHESKRLEPFVFMLVPMLDGNTTGDDLAIRMKSLLDSGELSFTDRPEGEVIDFPQVRTLVAQSLEILRKAGLLVS